MFIQQGSSPHHDTWAPSILWVLHPLGHHCHLYPAGWRRKNDELPRRFSPARLENSTYCFCSHYIGENSVVESQIGFSGSRGWHKVWRYMKFIRNHYLWKERQRKQNLAREKSSCTTVLTKQWPTQWSKYCLSVFLYLVKTASLLCPASGSQMEGSHTWKGVTLGGAAFCNRGQSWRSWQPETVYWLHFLLPLGSKTFLEGGSGGTPTGLPHLTTPNCKGIWKM